jgi:phospholipase C
MTGTIDPDGEGGGPVTSNKEIKGGFRWTTYAERLQKAGISWKVYQQQDNYGCNVLEYFKAFKEADRDSPLYNRGMVREPEGKFEHDAISDQLPTVSWIIPTSTASEHPDFMPAAGASFVASKLNAIAANPEVWAKTAFILNYDENDGLFDHVPPPVPPDGTPQEFVRGLPIGGGFRVPCLIISPWTAGGWVCSQPFDHTSVLQFLEKLTGVREPNISAWRRQAFGDLTAAFRFDSEPGGPPRLPDTVNTLSRARFESAYLPKPTLPGSEQVLPHQESGPRRRLPRNR